CANQTNVGNNQFVEGQVRALDNFGNVANVSSIVTVDVTSSLGTWTASQTPVTIASGASQSMGTPWRVTHNNNGNSTTTITGKDRNTLTITAATMTASK